MLRQETEWFTPAMCRAEPDALFVFGDNLARRGKGGQAVIRDEPNAVGIPTKRRPSRDSSAFFTDADLLEAMRAATPDLQRIADHLKAGGAVVWPADGIGTGRAELEHRAPVIWDWLMRAKARLEELSRPHTPASGALKIEEADREG
jgi:hypothetical protein